MCLTCGCNLAHEDHGVRGHLTYDDVARSAAIDGVSVDKAMKVLRKTMKADRKDHPDEYGKVADAPPNATESSKPVAQPPRRKDVEG